MNNQKIMEYWEQLFHILSDATIITGHVQKIIANQLL